MSRRIKKAKEKSFTWSDLLNQIFDDNLTIKWEIPLYEIDREKLRPKKDKDGNSIRLKDKDGVEQSLKYSITLDHPTRREYDKMTILVARGVDQYETLPGKTEILNELFEMFHSFYQEDISFSRDEFTISNTNTELFVSDGKGGEISVHDELDIVSKHSLLVLFYEEFTKQKKEIEKKNRSNKKSK